MSKPRIVCWFSCGDASAVATKLIINQRRADAEIVIARCVVAEEHPDNDRFAAECENWFGQTITNLRSKEYASCEAVWRDRKFMSSRHGAPCSQEMKKAVRWAFEKEWAPDFQVFGFTVEEGARAKKFAANNPDVRMLAPLIDAGFSKSDCHAVVNAAHIPIPTMYWLGYSNNNCIGCVKAQAPSYWNRVRRTHPEVFAARAALSRELGVRLVMQTFGDRPRFFLDELDPALDAEDADPDMECSLLCEAAGAL